MDLIPAIGVLIAITQACIAFAVFWSARRQKRIDRGTQRIVRIHDWGNDCIDTLAEAEQFYLLQVTDFTSNGSYRIQKSALLHRLSALIDRGRLFYKNVGKGKVRDQQISTRDGYRPEILDPLMVAYRSLLASDETVGREDFERLFRWRVRFITLLQYELDPDWLQEARYYSEGPGAGAGISLGAKSEPSKWPEDRVPI